MSAKTSEDEFVIQEAVLIEPDRGMGPLYGVRLPGWGWRLAYYEPTVGQELDLLRSSHTSGFATLDLLVGWYESGGHDD